LAEADPLAGFHVELLHDRHARSAFECGVEALDRYLRQQARQDRSRHIAAVYVATPDGEAVAGYYTLSAHSVRPTELPVEIARKLPRYSNVPTTLLGRLAVDTRFRGRGIGEFLLLDALRRAWESAHAVASMAVLVDAKDEAARRFYLRYRFIPFPESPNRLFIPIMTIGDLFR